MRALQLYAGPAARQQLAREGLSPAMVHTLAGAAGGPKGLVLGPLDRFLFGEWLRDSPQPLDLVGASIGAWRMATACLPDPVAALLRFEQAYVHQHYPLMPGERSPAPERVSADFGRSLAAFFDGQVQALLGHPSRRLHLVTARGRHVLGREQRWRTPLGYLGAYLSNALHRRALGAWLERVVFSAPAGAALPFATHDFRSRQVALTEANFLPALQASCSIPFVLRAVQPIPGAPAGAYWDGGITDYHLHLDYAAARGRGIVLYPHFQPQVVPGWLDKRLPWRHRATPFLDTVLLLAPRPEWLRTLPHGRLPDRTDFARYANDVAARARAWNSAIAASAQLADEFAAWLRRPDMDQVLPL